MTLHNWMLAATAFMSLVPAAATAQTVTAYQSGLQLAQQRGYANPGCYAQVFAKHAVVIENAPGKRNWFAASTPAYNAEQRSRCGIDRLADPRIVRQARGSGSGTASGTGAGLNLAAKSGYTGQKQTCFAKVYATYATPSPRAGGPNFYAIDGRLNETFRRELFTSCGISR